MSLLFYLSSLLVVTLPTVTSSLRWAKVQEFVSKQIKLSQSNLLDTTDVEKEFKVTLEFRPLNGSYYANIIDFDKGIAFGYGGPTIYLVRFNRLRFVAYLNGKYVHFEYPIPYPPIDKWLSIEVRQVLLNGSYVHRICVNGHVVHEAVNRTPIRRSRAPVYASEVESLAADGFIRKFRIYSSVVRARKASVVHQKHPKVKGWNISQRRGWVKTQELIRSQEKLSQTRHVGNAYLEKVFRVTFQFQPISGHYGNIINFDNSKAFGYGGPTVYYSHYNGKVNHLHFGCYIDDRYTESSSSRSYQFPQWVSVDISQEIIGGKYLHRIFVDGHLEEEHVNSRPFRRSNVPVYASEMESQAANGNIRKLYIYKRRA